MSIFRGQVRRLDPPVGCRGESRLILVLDAPEVFDMPDDISVSPGPCRVFHAVLLDGLMERATVWDVLLPSEMHGAGFDLYAMADTLTTVRLPLDGDDRLGPVVGTVPDDVCALMWEPQVSPASMAELAGRLGYATGVLEPQSGDHVWSWRCREVRNLHTLMDWF